MLELLTHTAAKGAAVLAMALLLGLALRKVAAARRYAIWITAVAALAVLPLAMLLLPAWRVLPQASVAMDGPVFEPEVPGETPEPILLPVGTKISFPVAAFETQAPAPVKSRPAFSWQDAVDTLPAAWITLSALLLLRLGWSAWRLHRLERSLEPGNCAALDEITREVGLKRVPRLLIGTENAVPMVWGVWRPRLLLPAGFESWTAGKLRGVLLHELAHLKRGDPLALWTAQWVKALHWFNPLAWLTIRQLRADQERACDDAVLRHGVRASDYAQHLLDLSRHTRIAPGLALCALTITRCAPVEGRVKAILDPKRHREGLTPRWLLGLAGFALLTTLPVAMLHAIEGAKLRGRILDRNGVVLAESTPEKVRTYPLKTLAAHMIGYTRTPDEKHAQFYGGTALEEQHDAELAAGKDVTLTLDMRMQSLAYRAMKEAGVTRGAAVVLNPRTGEILAAVSLPSYDPNLFIPSITRENWESYLGNRDIPLLNRCVRGFAPGSTYKLLTGLAGGAAGISGQKFNCSGSVTYGNTIMQCWKQRQDSGGHGVLGMSEALAASCSCFWYQFGNAAGIEQSESMGRTIGFGSAYGITDDEDKGILPSPSWLKQYRPMEKWSNGYTANTSIGQGMVLATPLQMAVLAATVGNGGKVPQPGIIKQNGEITWRADLTAGTLSAADVGQLREGMRLVVNGGSSTGKDAKSDKVIIAGKTGTAQNWRRDAKGARQEDNHGWFIGFAPFENPTLAFAIIKNGARSGGGDCGPIAKRIVEEALALPSDGSGEVKPVGDAAGDAWEMIEKARAKVDAEADSLKQEIEQAARDAKTGFALNEFTVKNGHVIVRGVASGMIQALEFRERLNEIGKHRGMEWLFPVPKTLKDGKRVGFEALGTIAMSWRHGTGIDRVKEGLQILGDPRASEGDELLKIAGLAELPEEKWGVLRGELDENSVHFYLPKDSVVGWLRRSFGDQTDIKWLTTDEIVAKHYKTKNGWEVEASTMKPQRLIKVKLTKPTVLTSSFFSPVFEAEKAEALRSAFDAKAAAISSAIRKAKPDAKTDFVLTELKIGHGVVTMHGRATGMIEALEFRAKLEKIGEQFEMEWEFPVPKTMMDGKRVEFQARGIYQPIGTKNERTQAASGVLPQRQAPSSMQKEAPSNPRERHVKLDELKAKMKALRDEKPFNQTAYDELVKEIYRLAFHEPAGPAEYVGTIETRPVELARWQEVQKSGGLAALPSEALVQVLKERDTLFLGASSSFYFRFSSAREEVRKWLLASLSEKRQKSQAKWLQWPEAPEPFDRAYFATDECQITIHSPDGKVVHVTVVKRKRPILIAPDEATPPTPKTAAPKELEGVVSADSQWPAHPVLLMKNPFPLHLNVEDTYLEG